MHDPSHVRVTGPLAPFAPGFAAALEEQGYKSIPIAVHLCLMAHVSRWLEAKDLPVSKLTPKNVEAYIADRRAAGFSVHHSPRSLAPLVAFLEGLGVLKPPKVPCSWLDRLAEEYVSYLVEEQGLAASTIELYVGTARAFLGHAGRGRRVELGALEAGQVRAFVLRECRRRCPRSAGNRLSELRCYLRFLHVQGYTPNSLVPAVPTVAGWRQTGLPRGIEPAQVARIVASCDRDTALGRRDLAICTVVARLGLRVGEVALLELDDVDWRAGEISVAGKGGRRDRLPLPVDVGEALAAYLEHGRPLGGSRRLFRKGCAPYGALSRTAVRAVLRRACWRVGLPDVGGHRLRHTLATDMLRQGGSLTEIGQVLRHAKVATTAIYAKVDRDALRSLALPWPGGAA
jgi:site-specific recombinase XerD